MYTYLIIDDEELIRKGTIKKLSSMEEQIRCIGEAENGRDGISKIEELRPDIVVMDMQMPIMDGTQLLPYLFKHYPDLPLIVISGYRDFDYIKHAISAKAVDYILKPFSREDIQKCMASAIERLESQTAIRTQIMNSEEEKENALYEYDLQILKNLILGYHTDSTEISSKRLGFVNRTHNLILLTMHFPKVPQDGTVQKWMEDNGFGNLALYLSNPNHPQMGFLLLFIPEESPLGRQRLTRQVVDSFLVWSKECGFSALIGISETHRDLKELHDAFLETSAALNRQNLTAPLPFYYYQDEEPKNIFWDKADEFLFRIESGMADEVSVLTEELFRHFLTIKDCTLADVKFYCYYLSNQCRLILNHYVNQTDSKTSASMQNIVNHLFLLSEVKDYYLQFFLNLTSLLKSQSVYAVDDVVEKIKIYMQRNYQKDLTQEYISYLFYLNRSYLSTLFKARTGEKFVDYLNSIRVEKAKELLLSSERKMYQVAKAVGYDNVKYFFRIFKKKTGVTPEQYRGQHDHS